MAATAVDIPTGPFVFDFEKAFQLCDESDITYTWLGAQTGKGYHSVRDILKGRTDPSAGWVGSLAMILGIAPGDLYRQAVATDCSVESRTVPQVKVLSRRRRLARRNTAS